MRSVRILVALAAAVGLVAPIGAQTFREAAPFHILISNDDGVHADGLRHVASILQAIGTVTIVAPAQNQSATGHSIVTSQPVFREDLTLPNGMAAIGLTATPATTVNIAIRNIVKPRPDLVVAGINRGYNLAQSVALSGTVGAAREAAMHGIPAIAASLAAAAAPREYIYAAEEVLGVARRAKERILRETYPANTFLNVNVPPMPEGGYKGYLVTRQAQVRGGQESFAETPDPRTGRPIYFNVYKEGATGPEGTDVWAVQNGYVSVTPMRIDETETAQLDALKAWFQ